jgi:hypothetical protein
MNQRIFLSKNGNIHGPFTNKEIESFIQSGKIHQYTWIWDPDKKAWNALDPAPTHDPETLVCTAGSTGIGPKISVDQNSVLIYSYKTLIVGNIRLSNVTGCEVFIPRKHHRHKPKLVLSSLVRLNQEHADGRTTEQIAKVMMLESEKDGWVIRLRWAA